MDFLRRYLTGVRLLGRGLRLYAGNRPMWWLGLLPAVLTALVFFAAFLALLFFLGDLATAATWFADDWAPGVRTTARVIAGAGVLGVSMVVGVLSFTAITLLVGDPFYERISHWVEGRYGGVPEEVVVGFWRGLGRSIAESARLLGRTVLYGVPLFLAGFLPVVGQTVVPVVGATVGGWFLAMELVSVPFSRRGLGLADRRRRLAAHRPEALGFGTAVFLCFLVPLGAVFTMPAAVAGGTLLARRILSGDQGADITVPSTPPRPGDG